MRAWLGYLDRWRSNFQLEEGLQTILREEIVAPTSSLFERWMLVRIYAALLEVGFVPVDSRSILDVLHINVWWSWDSAWNGVGPRKG